MTWAKVFENFAHGALQTIIMFLFGILYTNMFARQLIINGSLSGFLTVIFFQYAFDSFQKYRNRS